VQVVRHIRKAAGAVHEIVPLGLKIPTLQIETNRHRARDGLPRGTAIVEKVAAVLRLVLGLVGHVVEPLHGSVGHLFPPIPCETERDDADNDECRKG